MTYETRRTDWIEFGHHGQTHYRIWQRTDGMVWQQRHEWKSEEGTIRMDDWIRGGRGWTAGAQTVTA